MDDQTQPQPTPQADKIDLRKTKGPSWYKRGTEVKSVDGEKLLPEVVKAALGAKSFKAATEPLSDDGKRYLAQALRQDVDEWRRQFSAKLRTASEELLDLTMQEMSSIPPAARAYTLAVLVDKAQVLEGKTAMNGANVSVQINNYGHLSKADLLKRLKGEDIDIPVDAETK